MNRKSSVLLMGGAIAIAVMGGITFAMLQPGDKNSTSPTPAQPSVGASSTTPSTPISASQQVPPPASPADTTSGNPAAPPASPKPAVREVQSCVVKMATVNDPNPPLNVRSNPTTSSKVVGKLENGAFLSVAEEQDGWFRITDPVTGWVAKSRTSSGCSQKTERVRFGTGEDSIQIRDRFIGTGTHSYLFNAQQGQIFTITSQNGPLPEVLQPDGKSLLPGPDDQRTQWSGRLPVSGDYRVQLDSNYKGYQYTFTVAIK